MHKLTLILSLTLFTLNFSEARPAFFVIIDGLTGCSEEYSQNKPLLVSKNARFTQEQFLHSLKGSGIEPTVVFGCFGPDRSKLLGAKRQVSDFRFQRYLDQRGTQSDIQRISFGDTFPHPILEAYQNARMPAPIQKFFEFVSVEYQKMPANTPTYVIGHSYGAWAAMLLMQQKILAPNALITVEAISPAHCYPANIAKLVSVAPGCTEAPPEFDTNRLNAIRNQSGFWLNVFQDQFRRLHSSPIAAASENILFDTKRRLLNAISVLNDHHTNTWKDSYVWERLKTEVTR
jgi:hypothetical protein